MRSTAKFTLDDLEEALWEDPEKVLGKEVMNELEKHKESTAQRIEDILSGWNVPKTFLRCIYEVYKADNLGDWLAFSLIWAITGIITVSMAIDFMAPIIASKVKSEFKEIKDEVNFWFGKNDSDLEEDFGTDDYFAQRERYYSEKDEEFASQWKARFWEGAGSEEASFEDTEFSSFEEDEGSDSFNDGEYTQYAA